MDKQTLLKKFGKNVKIARIKMDLTQEKLAEIMNVSQNYVANIECGKANMSIAKLYELSNFLKTNMSELVLIEN